MDNPQINLDRLISRIEKLGKVGARGDGGVCRLALTEEDRQARQLLRRWLEECNAMVKIDRIGNMFGIREGTEGPATPAVMAGSHLDTVITGGQYDGSLGVLIALEIMEVLEEENISVSHPYAVVNFTNEEGVRFTPGMMGSKAFIGTGNPRDLLKVYDTDNEITVGEALKEIGFNGEEACGFLDVKQFVELHIEQGPVLEREGVQTAAVESVQGIYWTEYTVAGEAGHAGTTPVKMRKDAGIVAARINSFVRHLSNEYGAAGTVGYQQIEPNATNVIPEKARLRVDLRHPDKKVLQKCQQLLDDFVEEASITEGTQFERKELIRVDPVQFDRTLVELIERQAGQSGITIKRMASGAGHDAQMMVSVCPSAMIFVPSVGGISHNVNEFTRKEQIEAGANLMLQVVLELLQ